MESRISGISERKTYIRSSSLEEGNPAVVIGKYNDSSEDQSHPALPVDNDDSSAGNDTVTEDGSEFKASDNDIMKTINESMCECSDNIACNVNEIRMSNDLTDILSSAKYAIPSTSKDPATENDRNSTKVLVRPCDDQPMHDSDYKLRDKADKNANNDLAQGKKEVKNINNEHEMQIHRPTLDKDQLRKGAILSSVINYLRKKKFPYQCKKCSELFPSEAQLSCHSSVCTGKKKNYCDRCGKSWLTEEGLSYHIDARVCDESYKCKERENTVHDSDSLAQYNPVYTDDMPHTGNTSGKAFPGGDAVSNGRHNHDQDKQHQSIRYEKSFTQAGSISARDCKQPGSKYYKCKTCGDSFIRQSDLTTHECMHTSETPYECKICGKLFAQPSTLSSHVRTHTGEKPYKCTICNKSFTTSNIVKNHERTHTGEKPFKCKLCDKSFTHSGNLTKHLRTHTGEKPYKCTICGNYFTTPSNLKTHTRTHTGEKPYKCELCGKCFTWQSGLTYHQQKSCNGVANI